VAENGNVFQLRAGAERRRWISILGIAGLVCGSYVAGRSSRPNLVRVNGVRQVLYYVDPMHPAYRSNKPGRAPDCGMDLEPVYAGGGSRQHPAMSRGSVHLTQYEEQAVRFETETVRKSLGNRVVHTVGRVTPDEALSYSLSAGADGWVRRVFSDRTGTYVKRGQPLAAVFIKDISASQQAYLYALESYKGVMQTPPSPANPVALARRQLATARDELQFLGMGEAQIEELGWTGTEVLDINLTAPADRWIVERHVAAGQRFLKGEPLYRIANLKRVWILADVQPGDMVSQRSLRGAKLRLNGLPPFKAQVSAALPQFDEQGRTGRFRLEVNNVGASLVPGMIVNVDLEIRAALTITAHTDAVIDSGTSKHVFVARGDGQYELREVDTGWQDGDRVEIRSGLTVGDRVVTSGAFLLDSESRLKNPTHELERTGQPARWIERLIEFSAWRRGVVVGLVSALTIWGWWSISRIPLDVLPDLSDTQVILYSRWDRSAGLVEDQVTYPIVTGMPGLPKVKAVRGISDFGSSFVYVIFEDGTDLYWARSRTQEYLALNYRGWITVHGSRQWFGRNLAGTTAKNRPVRQRFARTTL